MADAGQEFTFVTGHRGKDMTKWTYRFDPVVNGTTVTESFEMVRDMPWYYRFADRYLMGVKDRTADLVSNMEATLQRLKTATEEDLDRSLDRADLQAAAPLGVTSKCRSGSPSRYRRRALDDGRSSPQFGANGYSESVAVQQPPGPPTGQ